MTVTVARATPGDAALLHSLARVTFPLACPPTSTPESIERFIATNLSEESFGGYLAEPERELFIVSSDGVPAGYSMVVYGGPTDPDVAAAVSILPTAEVSKVYVMAEQHGAGVAAALIEATVDAARERGCAGAWLGVNQHNPRANRFYEKHGFSVVGTKTFLLGDVYEDDFVRERAL